jgi:predicted MFS family arabinose efflux permease
MNPKPVSVLRNRNFVLLWLAQCISAAGDSFTFLALAVRIDSLYADPGESASALGRVLIAYALPVLVLGIFAGTIVDRKDRKLVMVLSDLGRALLAPGYLLLRTQADLPLAIGVAFLLATFSVFFYPARTALVPAVVEKEQLMTANAWMQVGATIARISGPILAGLVVGRWGTGIAFWVDSGTFFLSGSLVLGIFGVTTRVIQSGETGASTWGALRDGLRFIRRSRLLQGITLGISLAMLGIGAINVLFVPYLRDAFDVTPQALGGVQTAQGVGMLLGGLVLGWLGKRLEPRWVAIASMMMLAAGTVLFGAAPAYSISLLAIPIVGFSLPPLNASLQTMLQVNVPGEMLGRAGSVMDMAISLANVLSMGMAGWLGATIGLRESFYAGGMFVFMGAIAMGLLLPARQAPNSSRVVAGEFSEATAVE